MRAVLLNPPVSYYTGINLRLNPTLALPYISAMLKSKGHRVAIVDMEALEMNLSSVQGILDRFSTFPDAIGITALSASARGAEETIKELRRCGYKNRIIVGGVYASLYPEKVLGWEGVNTVVTGECEGNVVSIFEEEVDGIIEGVPVSSLADLPLPDFSTHIPSFDHYHGNPPFLLHPEAIAMWSRGCPHRCIYCGNKVFGHQRTRFRPPPSIQKEVEMHTRGGIKSLFVYDDELAGIRTPKGWIEELSERLSSSSMVWKCQGRCSAKHVTYETMKRFYSMGCRAVMWGVETFSQNTLNNIKKDATVEDIWATLRASKEAGIFNWVFTMIGNYGETEEDVILTLKGLEKAYKEGLIDYRQTTVATALPDTELERLQKSEGWYQEPPEKGPLMYQTYHSTPWLTANKIDYYLRMFNSVCPANIGVRKLITK